MSFRIDLMLTLFLVISSTFDNEGLCDSDGNALKETSSTKRQDSRVVTIRKAIESEADSGRREKRQAFRNGSYPGTIWGKIVPYWFNNTPSNNLKKEFENAMRAWEADTCINFTEVPLKNRSSVNDYLLITTDAGCSSHVGKLGGWQPLSLASGCENFGHAAHELGHALGLFHTMGRHDRDKYITVNISNIENDYEKEFEKQTKENNRNYRLPYDYGSIMHYHWRSASRNKEPTMIPKDIRYKFTLGSEMISFIDFSMINVHYKCKGMCNSENSIECSNGGYPHPRNCSKCLCPGGYGGDNCTERPTECGARLQAEIKWNKLNASIRNHDPNKYLDGYHKCVYWIESPPNTLIKVKLGNIYFRGNNDGCTSGGVEIKTNKNQTLTGYRFCSHDEDEEEDDKVAFLSHGNRVPIIAYSREFFDGFFNLRYRYVNESRREVARAL